MSESNPGPHDPASLSPLEIVALANKQLTVERAYLLIDNYIAEMAQQDARASLGKIKARLRARLVSG